MSGYIGPKTSDVPIGTISTKGTVSANSLVIGTNNVTIGNAIYVASNGNVGIGTSAPAYELEVSNGSIGITGLANSNISFTEAGATYNTGYVASYIKPSMSAVANTDSLFAQSIYPSFNPNGVNTPYLIGIYNNPKIANSSSANGMFLYNEYNVCSRDSDNDSVSGTVNLVGSYNIVGHNNSSNTSKSYTSTSAYCINNSLTNMNGSIGTVYGTANILRIATATNRTANATTAYGFYTTATVGAASGTGTGIVTNYYDAYLNGVTVNTTGTVTNKYGIYQVKTDHINYFGGNTGIGNSAPAHKLSVNGNTYFTNSISFSDSTQFNSAASLGMRNRIINGAFDTWQRGTSVTLAPNTSRYWADRWTSAGYQQARHQRISVTSPPSGLIAKYALRASSSTTAEAAGGTRIAIRQKIESLNCYDLSGQTITLSFWIKFSAATISSISNTGQSAYGDFYYTLMFNTTTTDSDTGSDIGGDSQTALGITNGSLPTTWTKYTLTATVPSGCNNISVNFQFGSLGSTTSADTAYYDVTQVQIEAGSVATPFERRPYGIEFFLCQRYYQKYGPYTIETYSNQTGYVRAIKTPFAYPVPMRTTPNRVVVTAGTMTNVRGSSTTYAGLAPQTATHADLFLETNNSTGPASYVSAVDAFDAEL